MSNRESEIENFIVASGWGAATVESFPGDASSRRYFRLTSGENAAVLMDAPKGAETPAEPEGASVEDRAALGYNALARLAGPEPAAFACLSYGDSSWRVRNYDEAALLTETHLFLDWYAKDTGAVISDAARAAWDEIWLRLFEALAAHAPGLALRDFHAENLFWLPERQSVSKVGLIDFQDGLFVHPAYDLVSFLEDARRDVSLGLVDPLISQFVEQAKLKDEAAFRRAYAVLGAQRNAKILGIFVRLAERDGKPAYRELIPRVQSHFVKNLSDDRFADLRAWFKAHLPGKLG